MSSGPAIIIAIIVSMSTIVSMIRNFVYITYKTIYCLIWTFIHVLLP